MSDKKKFKDLEKKPISKIFPNSKDAINKGICPTCGREITGFRDALSKKEFEITGVCQNCQDKISALE